MDVVIQEKLKKLRDYYYDDERSLKIIDGYEKHIRQNIVKDKLMENASVVSIVNEAKKRVALVDLLLKTDKTLTDIARIELFKEKEVHKFYIDRFDNVDIEKRMDAIHSVIDIELNKII